MRGDDDDAGRWTRRGSRRRLPIILLILGLLLIGAGVALYLAARPIAFALVHEVTVRKFPTVEWIDAEELAAWREDSTRGQPLLLDARTAPEYELSHLAGARRIDPYQPRLRHLEAFARDTPIVVYCSIGYRSARVTRWLGRQGFTNVRNLDGSLFAWANQRRPLEVDGKSVGEVHPYNELWGRLLKPEVRADAPPVTDPLSLP